MFLKSFDASKMHDQQATEDTSQDIEKKRQSTIIMHNPSVV